MGSSLPTRLKDIVIMERMGWTYWELMDTPAGIVDDIRVQVNAEAALRRQQMAQRKL